MSTKQKISQSYTKLTPNEYRSYDHKRRQIYGQAAAAQAIPSAAAERDYNTYSDFTVDSNASVAHYEKTYQKVTKPKDEFHSLEQWQHQELVSPASQAATDTNFHAGARNAFLDNHPFAYRDMTTRINHEEYADNAVEQARHYRQVYDTHYERAGAPPRRESPPYGTYGSPVPPPQRPGNPRIPAPGGAYGQASYSAQGSSTAATSSAYRQSRSDPRIPSPSEAYGQASYSGQGSATTATSSTYRQPRSEPVSQSTSTHDRRVPTASEAYGQASYSTRSSARVPVPTSYSQLPSGSPPPPRRLHDPRIPSPEQAYGNFSYGRRQDSRE